MSVRTAVEYGEQIKLMLENGRAWLERNPRAIVQVQFNYPPEACMIGAISAAVDKKIVTSNDDGLKLLKDLWPWESRTEPTVTMVRFVLEHLGMEERGNG